MKPKGKKPARSRRPQASGQSNPAVKGRRGCSIVGIGASAGGLEAFTQLLKHLPLDTGFGFVLVQHLDPQHESALTQLLARATAMPVHEVTNNLRVEANHVYIIPPNTTLGITGGVLKLQPRTKTGLAPRSIDNFFETLARDLHERAIGVILSGSATDGTLGLEAIKAEGGLTFAQDDSARYNSMPRSATVAGCVDFVLAPAGIARELARIARHPYVAGRTPDCEILPPARRGDRGLPPARPSEQTSYQKILLLLRNHSGVDFSLYKATTIHRRMKRRAVLNRRDTLEGYADFLRGNAKELDALYSDSLINVTSFFRNPEAFVALKQKVFARLFQERSDEPLRVWVLACSTGQEAYSIAMAFAESAGKIRRARPLQIFATDLNDANLAKARHGLYPKSLAQDVSPERLRRFFVEEEGGYRVIKALREQVVFARHNLISDPPFSRMDLISCRNLMIYLEPSLQKKVLPAFHYALKPAGFLFLGASESIGSFTDLFAPLDKKQKIFFRKAAPTLPFQLSVRPAVGSLPRPGPAPRTALLPGRGGPADPLQGELSAEREADRVTLNQFAPPSVLINADLQILQFRGPTGAYLEPPTGKASFDLLKMAREGLMLPLRALLTLAKKENQTTRKENVPVNQQGKIRTVNLEVVPLKNLKEPRFLVLFEDPERLSRPPLPEQPGNTPPSPGPAGRKAETSRVAGLERDLAETRDYLQSVQEHQEASNEELQASNEEGQSANEELQSLNEELETSKEELESTNEELTTVNEEMVSRNTELNRVNSDLTNLQASTKLIIVLLGCDLTIRRFSVQAEKKFGLLAADVGLPFRRIRHTLEFSGLEPFIAEVISSAREREREVRDQDGRWYSLRVSPYLNLDRKVDGAVLVLVDINAIKETELEVSSARDFAEAIIGTTRDPLLILDSGLRVQKASKAFYKAFRISPADAVGRTVFELDHGQWDIPRLRQLLQDILPGNSSFNDFEVTHHFAHRGRRTLLLNARTLKQDPGHREKILLGFQDITQRKQDEAALSQARAQLARHADELERLVAERTAELTAANRQLKASIETVLKGREKYRLLLLESQVMQEKLRRLTHQVLSAQEDERRKISRELHDEVVQTLVGINVELAALNQTVPAGNRILQARINRTQRLVEKSVKAVHQFARELRPAVLDDLGLIPALHACVKSVAARENLQIRLTAFARVETLDIARRTVLYRVAQEALTNVGRHAQASLVDVCISRIPGGIRLEVHDNGKSFPVEQTLSTKTNRRLGLLGMRERVEMVGGTLSFDSAPGHGTTVRAEIPFNPRKKTK